MPTPLQQLETICEEIFERWDKDMRSGKLLQALAGKLPGYRADVDAVRNALMVRSGGPSVEGNYLADIDG